MLVEEIMKKDVITLPPNATITNALALLQKYRIRHIPIVDEEQKVIGIVSDRDVRDASPSILEKDPNRAVLENEIQTIMTYPVVTVHPLDFVEDIARIFFEPEFACVPVVSNNKLIGIVTEKDMLSTMIQLTGTHEQGSQIEVKVQDRPGMIPKITNLFGKRKINIISILVYPYKHDPDFKVLVFRIQTMNPNPVLNDLKQAGFEVLWPQQLTERRP